MDQAVTDQGIIMSVVCRFITSLRMTFVGNILTAGDDEWRKISDFAQALMAFFFWIQLGDLLVTVRDVTRGRCCRRRLFRVALFFEGIPVFYLF